jgi:hypothetical protein
VRVRDQWHILGLFITGSGIYISFSFINRSVLIGTVYGRSMIFVVFLHYHQYISLSCRYWPHPFNHSPVTLKLIHFQCCFLINWASLIINGNYLWWVNDIWYVFALSSVHYNFMQPLWLWNKYTGSMLNLIFMKLYLLAVYLHHNLVTSPIKGILEIKNFGFMDLLTTWNSKRLSLFLQIWTRKYVYIWNLTCTWSDTIESQI